MANDIQTIQNLIYEIRGQRVMLDRDLAELYGVKTGRLNEQVKRNIERFPEDFMFQLTKGEFEIWKSQITTSNSSENQDVNVLISQIATSKPIEKRGGTQKTPYAFTENGVAMLSSVLRSPLAIQVNIGIMRAFVAFRRMSAALPAPSADVAQLRKDFEDLKQDIEEILHDQNEINEDTRAQLDAINDALTQLQAQKANAPERPEIGYVAVQKQREKSQNYPPQLTKLNKNNSILGKATPALHHTAFRRMSRAFDVRRNCFRSAELKRASLSSHLTAAFYCLCLIVSTFSLGSCQQEETHISEKRLLTASRPSPRNLVATFQPNQPPKRMNYINPPSTTSAMQLPNMGTM